MKGWVLSRRSPTTRPRRTRAIHRTGDRVEGRLRPKPRGWRDSVRRRRALHSTDFCFSGNGWPVLAVHVEPLAERLVFSRVGTKPEHVAVNVFHLHFVCPGIVRRGMTNLCTSAPVVFEQSIGIFDADPNPAAAVSLVALAQENVALAAADRRKNTDSASRA